MALISQVAAAIATAQGLPPVHVGQVARAIREKGFLSKGARGVNAPHATVRDCANLLIAVNACGCFVKDAPTAVEDYRQLLIHAPHGSKQIRGLNVEYGDIEHDELKFLDQRHRTFGEVLESVIDRFIGGELEHFMRDQTLAYLNEQFLTRTYEQAENDPEGAARVMREASDGYLFLETVAFRITFRRPNPFAEIVVDRQVGREREMFAAASFMISAEQIESGRFKRSNGDTRDQRTIGYRTLAAIAEVMRK